MLRAARRVDPGGSFVAYEHKDKQVKFRPLPLVGFLALIIGVTALGSIMVSSRASRELSPNRPASGGIFLGVSRAHPNIRVPGITVPATGGTAVVPVSDAATALARYKRFEIVPSPKPVAKPSVAPAYYHTRGCTCKENWQEIIAKYPAPAELPHGGKKWTPEEAAAAAKIPGESVCTCEGVACLPAVTPAFLTEAIGQDVCSLRRHTGYGCTARCTSEGEVHWNGFSCLRGDGVPPSDKNVDVKHLKPCDPLIVTPSPTPTASPTTRPALVWTKPEMNWDPKEVVDLRGLGCELLNGKEQCYMEDSQGRELCPPSITSESLMAPTGPYARDCNPENAKTTYCTVLCQEGNAQVAWSSHNLDYCYSPGNAGNCPPRPSVVPKAQWSLKPWSEDKGPIKPCQAAHAAGVAPKVVDGVTLGLLTHEAVSFADSMETYEANGLFDVVPEILIYMNGRNPAMEEVAQRYVVKHPGKIRLMGDGSNRGIARAMVAMTEAAKGPYFLFMERDFQLVEPGTCVEEQLSAGVELLAGGAADVVRYRHRKRAGRPNWAERFFKGHEEDAFYGRQPNLACNHYYWIPDPEVRWPDIFWTCGKNPQMLCSDSWFCNWTNNPQLWRLDWWQREYVSRFDKFRRNDPWDDLESYMNWEPGSWNDRGFTVAQGDGLFKHTDRTKIWSV